MLIHPMLDICITLKTITILLFLYFTCLWLTHLSAGASSVKKSLGQVRLHMFKNHVQVKK